MSLEQLIKKLKPTFLDAASQIPGQPFVLFLAASDMKVRAVTRHVIATNPAAAWDVAVQSLKASLGTIKPTILRADWVIDLKTMTWAEFLTSITQIERNYFRQGLALDADFKIVFTEPELNGNSMLYRDGPNGDPKCVFNEEACNVYCQARFDQAFPTPNPAATVMTFNTAGAFASDVEKKAILLDKSDLASDHRPIDHTDADAILKLARNGASFFAREIKKRDPFLCDRYPVLDKIVPMRVPLKHFNFIKALLDVHTTYGRLGNSALGASITKAINYGINNYVRYRKLDDGSEIAYVVSSGSNEVTLGANGAALIAFAAHSVVMKTKKYFPLMSSLAEGILSMQKDNGSFAHALKLTDYTVKDQVHVDAFDGLAVLGLLKLYELNGDQRLLDAAERAFTYFIINEMYKLHDPLFVQAVDIITRYLPKREYFEFGIKNFSDHLRAVYHDKSQNPRRFGLVVAAEILFERIKSMPELSDLISNINADDLHATLERQAKSLVDSYFWQEWAMFFKRPETIVETFFLRQNAFRVMVLDMEFLMSGAVGYREYLLRRTSEPQPSAAFIDDSTLLDERLADMRRLEAISELMTPLDRLARRLKPKFLEVAGKNSYKPCRLFLSASSMQSRAVTRHACDPDPARAWTTAIESLRTALGTIQPTILRADWVVEVELTSWSQFNELLGNTKRNYFRKGFALDQNFAIAFTESEINANIMFYADGDKGSPFCTFRRDRSDEYCLRRYKCKFPTPEPAGAVWLFSTNGAFIADDLDEPLMITDTNLAADHRDLENIDDALILNCVRSGAAHLANEVQDNGQFIYGRFPCVDKVIATYNTGRHFSSLFAMLDVYGTYEQPTAESEFLIRAIERGLEYGIKEFAINHRLDDGTEVVYINEPKTNEIKVGCQALALLAFTRHAVLRKTDKYLKVMNGIADALISMQKPDGSFVHVLHSDTFKIKSEFRIIFFDGEAIFGLMRLYAITRDARLLEASERAFKHFVETDHWQHHDHWLSYAINELTLYQPKREYFEFGINNFLAILPYIYHRFTQVPTVMELTMAAYALIERLKSIPEMSDLLARVPLEDFYAAMEERARKLLNGYFWEETAMFFKRPESIVGAFYIRHDAFRVRIDDIQHFLGGLVNYRNYLARRDHIPQPSEALLNGKVAVTSVESLEQEPILNSAITPPHQTHLRLQTINSDPPQDFGIEQFLREYKLHGGIIYFMLRDVQPKASGLEQSAFRRVNLFKKQLGIDICILTNHFQPDPVEQCNAYGLDCPVLNMFDHFQEIDRSKERTRASSSTPTQKDYRDDHGRIMRRDTYDSLGFLSRHQEFDLATGLVTSAEYYRPDGSLALHEKRRITNGKSMLHSFELIDKGVKFNRTHDAIKYWLEQLTADDGQTYFLIGDRSPEYDRFYIDARQRGRENIFVVHLLHNLHVLEDYNPLIAPTKPWLNFLTDARIKSDAVMTLTDKQRADIIKRYGLSNVVTLPHALPSVERITSVKVDPMKIIIVGRLSDQKNPDRAIDVFKRVLQKVPQAHLHFYGKGPLRRHIQRRIDNENLSDSVVLEGFCNDMSPIFASSAIMLMASRYEGFGLVIQESMQQGCPVVAFDCNYGPSDMIEDGINGYLVPQGDIDTMVERIVRLLTDDELRKTFSNNCARSLEKFAPELVARQWAWLFHQFIQSMASDEVSTDVRQFTDGASETATIFFGGDVLIGRRMHWRVREVNQFGDIPSMRNADLRIVNLECVVSALGEQGTNKGEVSPFYYHARPEMINVLTRAGIDVVLTANNHTGDYGRQALLDQQHYLDKAGIIHVGSGSNVNEASKPIYVRVNDLIVAIFSVDATMKHFAASDDQAGVWFLPIDRPELWKEAFVERIADARKHADVVIVAPHWGINFVKEPSEQLKTIGRLLIDCGADAVLGCHSHLLYGIESYKQRPIIYDACNFLFDTRVFPKSWGDQQDTGGFTLTLTRDGVRRVNFTPLRNGYGYVVMATASRDRINDNFVAMCRALNTDAVINSEGSVDINFAPAPRGSFAKAADHSSVEIIDSSKIERRMIEPMVAPLPEWTIDRVPCDAIIEPNNFGPIKMVGYRIPPECRTLTRRRMIYIETFWMIDASVSNDCRLNFIIKPVRQCGMPSYDTSMDHDFCDWMWPVNRWKPNVIYRERFGVRPPARDKFVNVDLRVEIHVKIDGNDCAPFIDPQPIKFNL